MIDTERELQFASRLAVEVDRWQAEGLISAEQAHQLQERYPVGPGTARAVRLGPVATLLAVVGALVLGDGVLYFFAANWHVLPALAKVALIVAATCGAYAAGYWLQFGRPQLTRAGGACLLLGAMLFQAGIFLVAQIYNMPSDRPIYLLLGTAGMLPVAYAARSRPILLLCLIDGVIWLNWQVGTLMPDADPVFYLLPVLTVLIGVAVYLVGELHRVLGDGRGFAPIYQVLGLLTLLLPIYLFSFGDAWAHSTAIVHGNTASDWFSSGSARLTLGIGAALVLVAIAVPLRWRRDGGVLIEAGVLATVVLVTVIAAYGPHRAGVYAGIDALLFSLLLFGLALWLCVKGYLQAQARFVNLGVVVLALGLITRYFDSFWGLLPRAGFYLLAGLVLLIVATGVEQLRKRLLRRPVGPKLVLARQR